MRQFLAFVWDHIWPAAGMATSSLFWAYGVLSDTGLLFPIVLTPSQWQLIGGGGILVCIASLHFQWYRTKLAPPSVEPAQNPPPAINISSHHQNGGITAQIVNVGHRPRSISHPTARNLRHCLLALPREGPWNIVGVLGDSEAFSFGSEIHQFMKDNSFEMQAPSAVQGVYQRPVRGVVVDQEGKTIIVGTNTGLERNRSVKAAAP